MYDGNAPGSTDAARGSANGRGLAGELTPPPPPPLPPAAGLAVPATAGSVLDDPPPVALPSAAVAAAPGGADMSSLLPAVALRVRSALVLAPPLVCAPEGTHGASLGRDTRCDEPKTLGGRRSGF